jgi:methylated-DNA-[protein]-cysteine S-methyltransferase
VKVKSLIKEMFLSPIGGIEIFWDDKGVAKICFAAQDKKNLVEIPATDSYKVAYGKIVVSELEEYFAGKRCKFSLKNSLQTGTEFQRLVWDDILKIPFGETRTYAQIARNINRPGAARAVGMACNQNPLCIIVPCHRVVGSQGSLTGYAGGLAKKQWLLEYESSI